MALPGKRDRGDLDRLANAVAFKHYHNAGTFHVAPRKPPAIMWEIETHESTRRARLLVSYVNDAGTIVETSETI